MVFDKNTQLAEGVSRGNVEQLNISFGQIADGISTTIQNNPESIALLLLAIFGCFIGLLILFWVKYGEKGAGDV